MKRTEAQQLARTLMNEMRKARDEERRLERARWGKDLTPEQCASFDIHDVFLAAALNKVPAARYNRRFAYGMEIRSQVWKAMEEMGAMLKRTDTHWDFAQQRQATRIEIILP